MKLIADSGSTKTTWQLVSDMPDFIFHTAGINPVRDDESTMHSVVGDALATLQAEFIMGRASSFSSGLNISELFFYGAGCIQPYSRLLRSVLQRFFLDAHIAVESDLLGAARAMCGREEGIACILGTGSNSCLYDGNNIVQNVSPLGWILGDEGSGAVLGRTLVGDVLKGQLPEPLCAAFSERFHLTRADVIERVYRQPQPNRFLASLVPFLAEHAGDAAVHDLLVGSFRAFFRRNVAVYRRPDLPVHFVGGVAYQFESELHEAASAEHFVVGMIERSPIHKMADFHR